MARTGYGVARWLPGVACIAISAATLFTGVGDTGDTPCGSALRRTFTFTGPGACSAAYRSRLVIAAVAAVTGAALLYLGRRQPRGGLGRVGIAVIVPVAVLHLVVWRGIARRFRQTPSLGRVMSSNRVVIVVSYAAVLGIWLVATRQASPRRAAIAPEL